MIKIHPDFLLERGMEGFTELGRGTGRWFNYQRQLMLVHDGTTRTFQLTKFSRTTKLYGTNMRAFGCADSYRDLRYLMDLFDEL